MEDYELVLTLEAGLSKTVKELSRNWDGAQNTDGTEFTPAQKLEAGTMALNDMGFTKALSLVLRNSA